MTKFNNLRFFLKPLNKMGLKVTYLNIIKALYDKSTANIIFSGEKLKATSLRSGTEQGCPLLLLLFNIGLEILGKKKKRLHIGREEVKLSLVASDMILYIENPKDSTKKLLENTNEYSKVQGMKPTYKNMLRFYILTTN